MRAHHFQFPAFLSYLLEGATAEILMDSVRATTRFPNVVVEVPATKNGPSCHDVSHTSGCVGLSENGDLPQKINLKGNMIIYQCIWGYTLLRNIEYTPNLSF